MFINTNYITSNSNGKITVGSRSAQYSKTVFFRLMWALCAFQGASDMVLLNRLTSSIFLVLTISSFSASSIASSCIISEDMVLSWSEQHKENVEIKIRKDKAEYFVEISVSPIINGKAFKDIFLFKGKPAYDATKMDHEFSMPLGAWQGDENKMYAFYTIKPYLAKDNYLSISYGEDCGMYIQYPVKFELAME